MAGRSTPATTLLDRQGIAYRLHTYAPDPRADSYGADAAAALGLAPQQVFKTLVTEVDGQLVIGVVPVSAQLDLRALATAVGAKKARMAAVADRLGRTLSTALRALTRAAGATCVAATRPPCGPRRRDPP